VLVCLIKAVYELHPLLKAYISVHANVWEVVFLWNPLYNVKNAFGLAENKDLRRRILLLPILQELQQYFKLPREGQMLASRLTLYITVLLRVSSRLVLVNQFRILDIPLIGPEFLFLVP
jgi:hypothetical protein